MDKSYESYLVTLADASKNKIINIIVPNNREFSCLMDSINPELQVVMGVTPIANLIDFKEYMSDLRKSNKPNGLNFGDMNNEK
jgi:hypothetical protein